MMFDESMFFICVTCSLPVIGLVLEMTESVKRARKKRRAPRRS